jgi:hypothetical protein
MCAGKNTGPCTTHNCPVRRTACLRPASCSRCRNVMQAAIQTQGFMQRRAQHTSQSTVSTVPSAQQQHGNSTQPSAHLSTLCKASAAVAMPLLYHKT